MFKRGDLIQINISDQQFLPNWLQGKRGIITEVIKEFEDGSLDLRLLLSGESWVLTSHDLRMVDERF